MMDTFEELWKWWYSHRSAIAFDAMYDTLDKDDLKKEILYYINSCDEQVLLWLFRQAGANLIYRLETVYAFRYHRDTINDKTFPWEVAPLTDCPEARAMDLKTDEQEERFFDMIDDAYAGLAEVDFKDFPEIDQGIYYSKVKKGLTPDEIGYKECLRRKNA